MRDWESEVQPRFREAILKRECPIDDVAEEIFVSRQTVYRMMQGDTKPRPATQVLIERFVERSIWNDRKPHDSDD